MGGGLQGADRGGAGLGIKKKESLASGIEPTSSRGWGGGATARPSGLERDAQIGGWRGQIGAGLAGLAGP
jgi:hypothetical protein